MSGISQHFPEPMRATVAMAMASFIVLSETKRTNSHRLHPERANATRPHSVPPPLHIVGLDDDAADAADVPRALVACAPILYYHNILVASAPILFVLGHPAKPSHPPTPSHPTSHTNHASAAYCNGGY
jgi:hypothetical protein